MPEILTLAPMAGSRLYGVAFINALMVLGHILFYYAATGVPKDGSLQEFLLVVGTFGISYAFGAIWPHLVVLSSELFGSIHLPQNYMFYDGGCSVTLVPFRKMSLDP